MVDDVSVRVTGVAEFSRALKGVDTNLPKELRLEFKGVAEHVIGVAQQRMPFRTGEAAKSLKPRATQRGAGIAFPAGGRPWKGVKADYYPWLDFGGTTGRGRVAGSGHEKAKVGGAIVRPVIKGGRYLYPAIAESRQFIEDAVDAAVKKLAAEADFDTRETD